MMFNLYNHIAQLAREKGFRSVAQMCQAAGIQRSVMSELNAGRAKTLSPRTAQKIADALGVDIDVVFGRSTGKEISDADLGHAIFNGEEYTPEQLEEVKRFAKYVISRNTL